MTVISDTVTDQAERIREGLASTAKTIRADADLNDEGKRNRISQAHAEARERMDALKQQWRDRASQDAATSVRNAFGSGYSSGADAISIRDAEDRASQLETAIEARALLERAQRSGDKVLERAIGLEAARRSEGDNFLNRHWNQLLSDYGEANPSASAGIAALTSGSPEQGFQNALTFMLQRVDEL